MTKEEIKSTGSTFTPKQLASFLSSQMIKYISQENPNILDPACGDGELLVSIAKEMTRKTLDFSLSGYDRNINHLKAAEERLKEFSNVDYSLICDDFLDAVEIEKEQTSISFDQSTKEGSNKKFDLIIANPPYVRTQILGAHKAQELAKKFNLKGRIDLYYPFLIAMTQSLKDGGILGVITSNRYLSTKSGESVRKFLSENFQILEVIDLGDTKLFDAAVLPAIFIGRKAKIPAASDATFMKIYESSNAVSDSSSLSSIYEILESDSQGYFQVNGKTYKKTFGKLAYKIGSESSWGMMEKKESNWVSQVEKATHGKVGDFFKVKVGVKSTADKIFISDNWDRLQGSKPEEELLKELISQENIQPWNAICNLSLKVLYPHISIGGIKQTIDIDIYPQAKKYFLQHEQKLKSRKYLIDAGRKWFELWVPHNPEQWKLPKLVFPDISNKPRFCFDELGRVVNGNCYWIVANRIEDIEKLLLIQGLANSKFMTKYHDLVFNNRLYSGRRRYLSQYVEKYPLPNLALPEVSEIISIVQLLNNTADSTMTSELENRLEIKIAKAFNVDPIFTLD